MAQPTGQLTRDTIVDNITLYWLTGTGASAARAYWEAGRAQALAAAAGQAPPAVSVPAGFTTFPGEVFRAPRSWVELAYPNLTYFNEVDKGGHFAAWEEPELFSEEVRAAFRHSCFRLSSGGGSMPAQTTNLFLLEDLEDVGRTRELAESDLDALPGRPSTRRSRSPSGSPAPKRTCSPSGSRRWRRRRTATKSANRRRS